MNTQWRRTLQNTFFFLKWKSTVIKKMTISYALLILFIFLYKSLFLIQIFSFGVFERFKKEENKIRIKIL